MLLSIALFLLASQATPSVKAADPVRLDPPAADSIRAAIEKERAETETWLRTGSSSYLATVLRNEVVGQLLTGGRSGRMLLGPGHDAVVRAQHKEHWEHAVVREQASC